MTAEIRDPEIAEAGRAPQASQRRPTWFVEILRGIVSRDGLPVPLTPREFEVVVALAMHGPCRALTLMGILDSDPEFERSGSLVKVYVHRIRRNLGQDFVRCVRGMYQLSGDARVDTIEIERRLEQAATSGQDESPNELPVLLELARRIRTVTIAEAAAWDWFAPHCQRATALGRMFALFAARTALKRAHYSRALTIARQLGCEDPCDEEVRELSIRAYLTIGERAAAVKEYRDYERALRSELDLAPSSTIRDLMLTGETCS